jgi:hypothetical protein
MNQPHLHDLIGSSTGENATNRKRVHIRHLERVAIMEPVAADLCVGLNTQTFV